SSPAAFSHGAHTLDEEGCTDRTHAWTTSLGARSGCRPDASGKPQLTSLGQRPSRHRRDMGKIKRAKTPDGPREQSPVAKAAAVSALRETLRISEAANASERRESARRLSQQAHRFATSEDGLGIERVQIEADVRVRRVLNALRDKDDQLATAHRRIEDLENQLDLSREECAKLKERCLGLEDSLQAKKQELSHSEAVSTQRKMEGARIKGLLADCRFDLDLLGSKYERLLDERATIGLSRELVDAARRDMGGSFQDDGSAASSAKSFDVVSRLQAGVKASKAADADSQNEILVEEPPKFAANESDSDD
ncbi:unnamed protein product, partial [Pelagomonas calceolata]